MSAGGAKRGQTVFLVAGCAALAVIVVLLARQNTRLKAQVGAAVAAARAGAPAIAAGEHVDEMPSFEGVGSATDGSALHFEDGRRGTVIVVRSAGCGPCEAMAPFVEGLARECADAGVVVAAAQVDAKRPEDLEALGGGVRSVGVPEIRTTWLRRITAVPEFLLIDGRGVVRATWSGVLDRRQQDQVRDAVRGLAGGAHPEATTPTSNTYPGG